MEKNNHNNSNHYKYYKYYKYNKYYKHKKYYNNKNKHHRNNQNDNILLSKNVEMDNLNMKEEPKKSISDIEDSNINNIDNNSNSKMTRNLVLSWSLGIVIFISIIIGIAYSVFNYSRTGTEQGNITTAEVYARLTSPNSAVNIELPNLYPMTNAEARARNDNYVDFTVAYKNTGTKDLAYSIDVVNGEEIQGKDRIALQYLKVDIQEKINDEYVYVAEAVSLSDWNLLDTIPANTTTEQTKEYRLRLWVGDNLLISDTESNYSYTQSEFANLYANFSLSVGVSDVQEGYITLNNNNIVSLYYSNNVYKYRTSGNSCVQNGYIVDYRTATKTITSSHGGTISCLSSDTSIATCSVNGNTVTINQVADNTSYRTFTITITSAATANYNAASVIVNGQILRFSIDTSNVAFSTTDCHCNGSESSSECYAYYSSYISSGCTTNYYCYKRRTY